MSEDPPPDMMRVSWTVDPGYAARRVAWRVRQYLRVWVLPGVIIVAGSCWVVVLGLLMLPDPAGFAILTLGGWGTVSAFLAVPMMIRRELRLVRMRYPVGSTLTAEYGAEHAVFWGPMEELFVPYVTLAGVAESRGFVTLLRRSGPPFVVAAEQCPHGARERIMRGVTGAARAVRVPPEQFGRPFYSYQGYAREAARRAAVRAVARPSWFVPELVLLLGALGLLVWGEWLVAIVFAGAAVLRVIPAVNVLEGWRGLVGIVMRAKFDDDGFVFSDGPESVKWDYRLFDRVVVHTLVVELRTADEHVWGQYPRAIFPFSFFVRHEHRTRWSRRAGDAP